MPKARYVAVVDDEKDLADSVALGLKTSGYEARTFSDGDSFLFALKSRAPDLVILDLNMPGTDGLGVCRQMRSNPEHKAIPIIMLTGLSDVTDRIVGLELGADDYVSKPFNPRELIARVGAVLRRAESKLVNKEILRIGKLVVDPDRALVTLEGKPLDLTATEFRLLELLCSRPDRVFSRSEMLDYVWGYDKPVMDRTVDVHVKRLRDKLGPFGKRLKTRRGIGYKLASR